MASEQDSSAEKKFLTQRGFESWDEQLGKKTLHQKYECELVPLLALPEEVSKLLNDRAYRGWEFCGATSSMLIFKQSTIR